MQYIEIVDINIDGHTIDVPNELSELLNDSNAWCLDDGVRLKNIERKVYVKDGSLISEVKFI